MGKGSSDACERPALAMDAAAAPVPPQQRFFHGTTTAQRAQRIARAGFQAAGETFLTTHPGEARDYGQHVFEVDFQPLNPLEIDVADGPFPAQLQARGIPFEPQGGYLGPRTLSALRARGHDALIISYPADNRDPSAPMPARRIARVLDPSCITVRPPVS